MTVRCKFRCTEITKRCHWDGSSRFIYVAKFSVVMSGSPENKHFFDATPAGSLEVGCFKDDHFTPGQEYFLDILPTVVPS